MAHKLVGWLPRVALVLFCVFSLAASAAEKTVTVAAGETIGLADALTAAGLTLEAGDTLVKMGGGRLVGSANYSAIKVNLRVAEGIFEGSVKKQFFSGGDIAVKTGATLDINSTVDNGTEILNGRMIYLQGAGSTAAAVTVNGRSLTGALLIRGRNSYQLMNNCTFFLDGVDATIAVAMAGNIGYLTNGYISSKTGDHYLTLLGPGHTVDASGTCSAQYQHRYRYGFGFDGNRQDTGRVAGVIVDGASFTAHNVTYQYKVGQLPLWVKNGGTYGQEGDGFGKCFSVVEFEWGSIIAGDGACTITLPEIVGFPVIPSKVTATINKKWTAKGADIALDHGILAYKPLTFGTGAELAITDYGLLDISKTYTLARSTVSVSGCPAFTPSALAPQNWKIARGADGKTIELSYPLVDKPGVVDVRTWGIQPGEEHAEANVTAFVTGLAAIDSSVHTLFFPAGTTYFATSVPLSGVNNLTLTGDNGCSRIQVGDAATSVLAVTGGTDVSVAGLVLAGGSGVAVAANGTTNLSVTNCVFDGISGTIAEVEGTYPVSATDCANVLVRENTVSGTTIYTSHLYSAGTTTAASGVEPVATEVVLFAHVNPANRYETKSFVSALAERGLASYPQGAKLVKKGLGKVAGPTSTTEGAKLGAIDVQEGTLVAFNRGALGKDWNSVTVQDGASVLLEYSSGDAVVAYGTKFSLGGDGASATDAGAVLCVRSAGWQVAVNCTFTLRSDIRVRYLNQGEWAGFFSHATFDMNGHTLTVYSENGRGSTLRFRLSALFKKNAGPFVVDNLTLSASYKDGNGYRGEDGVKPPLLKIKSNARLLVNNQDFADVFDVYEFDPGGIYEAESNQALTTTNVKGAPAIHKTITLTIPGSYTARAADLLANKSMTSVNALTFGENCEVNVDGIEELPLNYAGYVLATSENSIPRKPKASASLKAAGWTTALASDGKSLLVKPIGGTMILFR